VTVIRWSIFKGGAYICLGSTIRRKKVKRLSTVFSDPPGQWGLNGEPELWEEFKAHFLQENEPGTEEKFLEELYDTFEELTGRPVQTDSFIYVKRFNRGGFGSGLIDPWNWRAVVIPTLARRYREAIDTF
jgi:hypothetical protein